MKNHELNPKIILVILKDENNESNHKSIFCGKTTGSLDM